MPARFAFSACIILLAGLAACGRAGAPQGPGAAGEVRFAVVSARPEAAVRDDWRPILTDMKRRTGLSVQLEVFDADAGVIEAWRQKTADVGLFSNLAALEIDKRGGAEIFARTATARDADARVSILVASAERNLTLDKAMACKRKLSLAMGDRLSTAGALAPMTYLFAPRNLDPRKCFRTVRVGAPAAEDLDAVAGGGLDLAFVSSAALTARAQDRPGTEVLATLWRSPPLPQDPLVWRKSLDPVAREKLRQFFITYGQGSGPDARRAQGRLARLDIGGFRPADDSHLLPVREMQASMDWYAAARGGDKARIEAAKAALDAVSAERAALEARTRAPAAAQ